MSDYNTQQELQDFFNTRLFTDGWDFATDTDRVKASNQATRNIDSLNYIGDKTDSNQENEIPRTIQRNVESNGITSISTVSLDSMLPDAKIAHAEETLALLNGIDPEKEINNIGKSGIAFASIRNARDTTYVLDHTRAGFASSSAFSRLKRYVIVNNPIKLMRV